MQNRILRFAPRWHAGIPTVENGTRAAHSGAANEFNAADEPERHNESIPGPHEPPSPHRWRRKPERLPRARAIPTRSLAGFRAGQFPARRQRSFHRAAQALRTPRGRLGRRACPEIVLPVWEGWRVLGVFCLCVHQGPPFSFPVTRLLPPFLLMNRRSGVRPSKAARYVVGASLARPWKAAPPPVHPPVHDASRARRGCPAPIQRTGPREAWIAIKARWPAPPQRMEADG